MTFRISTVPITPTPANITRKTVYCIHPPRSPESSGFFPQLGRQSLGLLKMRQRHQPFAFEEWLDGLLDELAMHLLPMAPLLLVLDDYHLAQGPVLDRCLQFFLNHLPDGLLVMVTSRQRPDWHLARLRLSRQLLELHEQDLRLTHAESQALLDRHSSSLSGEALDNLIRRSEGWVAGLRLWINPCRRVFDRCGRLPRQGGLQGEIQACLQALQQFVGRDLRQQLAHA